MGSKKIPGSLGHNFVGYKFYFVNEYYTNASINVRVGVNSWTRATHESHKHWSSTNNDDSTVFESHI